MLPFRAYSGIKSNGNEGVLHIPQSSSITETSPSDCLVSYPGHSLGGGSYTLVEVPSVYSTAQVDSASVWNPGDCNSEIRWKIENRVNKISKHLPSLAIKGHKEEITQI